MAILFVKELLATYLDPVVVTRRREGDQAARPLEAAAGVVRSSAAGTEGTRALPRKPVNSRSFGACPS